MSIIIQNESVVNVQEAENGARGWIKVCWLLGRMMDLRGKVMCPKKFLWCFRGQSFKDSYIRREKHVITRHCNSHNFKTLN